MRKYLKYIGVVTLFLFALVGWVAAIGYLAGQLVGDDLRKVPTERDLAREPEYELFAAARLNYKGIIRDMDSGLYEFEFEVPYASAAAYFDSVHSNAVYAGWRLVETSKRSRVYEADWEPYPNAPYRERVSLRFHPKRRTVRLRAERVYHQTGK